MFEATARRRYERAILTARLIDRPLRPCFPDGFRNEVHVVATVMTVDQANQPDIVAINGASAALMLSGIPFDGPVGAVRLAHIEGRWVPNPTFQEIENATFEIVVVGRRNEDGGAGILMVEAGATEIALDLVEAGAPEMTEELVAEGLEEAKTWILEAIAHQEELVAQAGRRTPAKTWVIAPPYDSVLSDRVSSNARERIVALISDADKQIFVTVTREASGPDAQIFAPVGLQVQHAIDVGCRSVAAGATGIMFMPFAPEGRVPLGPSRSSVRRVDPVRRPGRPGPRVPRHRSTGTSAAVGAPT